MSKVGEVHDSPIAKEKVYQIVAARDDSTSLELKRDSGTRLMSGRGDPGTAKKPESPEPETVKQMVKRQSNSSFKIQRGPGHRNYSKQNDSGGKADARS